MGGKAIDGVIAIAIAVVGLATLAVFFSKKANTSGVIEAAGSSFANIIKEAIRPVT